MHHRSIRRIPLASVAVSMLLSAPMLSPAGAAPAASGPATTPLASQLSHAPSPSPAVTASHPPALRSVPAAGTITPAVLAHSQTTSTPPPTTRGETLPGIRVSDDRRFFVTDDGQPFFYLADTGWTMVNRLTLDEVDVYLQDRRAKGFNVIQLVFVPWLAREGGNLKGDKPYIDNDVSRPNPAYFDHVERVLDRVQAAGMYPAVVPFWLAGLPDPAPGDLEAYRAYASYVGKRFGSRPMFWLLGADRAADAWMPVIRAFAEELKTASGRTDLLLTHHPQGGQSSSRWFHNDAWLTFNMAQSGHNLRLPHYRLIDLDYRRQPTKPVLDGEPAYENIVDNLEQYKPGARLVNAADVRRQAYQSVFAGAAGHAYGACEVYEFHREGAGKARWTVGIHWREAIALPGSTQVGYMKKLITSRPQLTRMPDQTLITPPNPEQPERHLKAIRDREGQFAMIYTPTGEPFRVNLAPLGGKRLTWKWFDPRTGTTGDATPIAEGVDTMEFRPPTSGTGQDWVLVLDAATTPTAR